LYVIMVEYECLFVLQGIEMKNGGVI